MNALRVLLVLLATGCAGAPPTKAEVGGEGSSTATTANPPAAPPGASKVERSACDTLPIFELYRRNGVLGRPDATRVTLELPIDLHEADCGAPDCFGHDMLLTLTLSGDATYCAIVAAEATSTAFDSCLGVGAARGGTWNNHFSTMGRMNLADPALERIELRDAERGQALVLVANSYYFYENVTPEKKLLPRIVNFENPECCGGYTYSKTVEWTEPRAP